MEVDIPRPVLEKILTSEIQDMEDLAVGSLDALDTLDTLDRLDDRIGTEVSSPHLKNNDSTLNAAIASIPSPIPSQSLSQSQSSQPQAQAQTQVHTPVTITIPSSMSSIQSAQHQPADNNVFAIPAPRAPTTTVIARRRGSETTLNNLQLSSDSKKSGKENEKRIKKKSKNIFKKYKKYKTLDKNFIFKLHNNPTNLDNLDLDNLPAADKKADPASPQQTGEKAQHIDEDLVAERENTGGKSSSPWTRHLQSSASFSPNLRSRNSSPNKHADVNNSNLVSRTTSLPTSSHTQPPVPHTPSLSRSSTRPRHIYKPDKPRSTRKHSLKQFGASLRKALTNSPIPHSNSNSHHFPTNLNNPSSGSRSTSKAIRGSVSARSAHKHLRSKSVGSENRPVPVMLSREQKHIQEVKRLVRQAKQLVTLYHPSIVSLYGLCLVSSEHSNDLNKSKQQRMSTLNIPGPLEAVSAFIVMQYCPSNLNHLLYSPIPHPGLSMEHTFRWVVQIANGLSYLHSKHTPHQSLQPCNILLTHSDPALAGAKLSDIGLAASSSGWAWPGLFIMSLSTISDPAELEGGILFQAPEVLRQRRREGSENMDISMEEVDWKAADVFSFATLVFLYIYIYIYIENKPFY